jgi:predicted DCC family thiol-disulfide oxidoreductase YuxK
MALMTELERPTLVFDDDCGFCSRFVYWIKVQLDDIKCVPYQTLLLPFNGYNETHFSRQVSLFLPKTQDASSKSNHSYFAGHEYHGADAIFKVLSMLPAWVWLTWLYARFLLVRIVMSWGYFFVARHRRFVSLIANFIWGKDHAPSTYFLGINGLIRGVGLIYLITFSSLLHQWRGLFGEHGIVPIMVGVTVIPNWLALLLLSLCTLLSALLFFGRSPKLCLAIVTPIYYLICSEGFPFMNFQWDVLLIELSIILLVFIPWRLRDTLSLHPNLLWFGRFALSVLLFRLVQGSGVVKLLSQDTSWAHGTAMHFHFFTQPLPHFGAFIAGQLPEAVHFFMSRMIIYTELLIPFFIFFPRRLKLVAFFGINALMIGIMLTGNYGFFNLLTMALTIPLVSDNYLRRALQLVRFKGEAWRLSNRSLSNPNRALNKSKLAMISSLSKGGLLAVFIFLSVLSFGSTFSAIPKLPLITPAVGFMKEIRFINNYGLFGVMTTSRPELEIYVRNDGEEWEQILFKYKLNSVGDMPAFIIPYMPRLDWQLWFAGIRPQSQWWWIDRFVRNLRSSEGHARLLIKDLSLISFNEVKVQLWEYQMVSGEYYNKKGRYWSKSLRSEFQWTL